MEWEGINQEGKKPVLHELGNLSPIEPLNGFSGTPKGQSTWKMYNINKLETSMTQPFKNDKTETVCVWSKIAIII